MRRVKLVGSLICAGWVVLGAARAQAEPLSWVWAGQGKLRDLQNSTPADLKKAKKTNSSEKSPWTGKVTSYQGASFNKLVDDALAQLPLEDRAQVDLIEVSGKGGKRAVIPRSLITKYPFTLAFEHGEPEAGMTLVVPWTSRSHIHSEGLPLESYFVEGVTRVVFANSRERYASALLLKKSDPTATRGQKVFLQSCMSCHAPAEGAMADLGVETKVKAVLAGKHPELKGYVPLNGAEKSALQAYLNVFLKEKAPVASGTPSSASR